MITRSTETETVIEIRGVRRQFGAKRALANRDLTVPIDTPNTSAISV